LQLDVAKQVNSQTNLRGSTSSMAALRTISSVASGLLSPTTSEIVAIRPASNAASQVGVMLVLQ
jgi:hypothetical protein